MSATVAGPLNPAQVITALPNATPQNGGVTITAVDATNLAITAPAYTDSQIASLYQGIVYDSTYQLPADANRATLQQRAVNALTANANYLAITSPTNAQVVAQVQTLTKECNGVIRLLLNQLDSTSGT